MRVPGFHALMLRHFGIDFKTYERWKNGTEIPHPVTEIVINNWIENLIARHDSGMRKKINISESN